MVYSPPSFKFFLVLFSFSLINIKSQTSQPVETNKSTDPVSKQRILIRSGFKLVDLNSFDEHSLLQNKYSRGEDSISYQIYAHRIAYKPDTLIVTPEEINIYRYLDTINAYSESFDYPPTTTLTIKVPVKEIESIKAKKQPLSKITGVIAAGSYVLLMCSPFIAMNANETVSNFGVKMILITAPMLAVSWSINAIWAKKRYHFNSERTRKNTWKFE